MTIEINVYSVFIVVDPSICIHRWWSNNVDALSLSLGPQEPRLLVSALTVNQIFKKGTDFVSEAAVYIVTHHLSENFRYLVILSHFPFLSIIFILLVNFMLNLLQKTIVPHILTDKSQNIKSDNLKRSPFKAWVVIFILVITCHDAKLDTVSLLAMLACQPKFKKFTSDLICLLGKEDPVYFLNFVYNA